MPLQVAFSLRERVDLRSQKEGILGKNIAWGRVGQTKEKRMHKKGGFSNRALIKAIFDAFKQSIFEASELLSTKAPRLKHDYRHP